MRAAKICRLTLSLACQDKNIPLRWRVQGGLCFVAGTNPGALSGGREKAHGEKSARRGYQSCLMRGEKQCLKKQKEKSSALPKLRPSTAKKMSPLQRFIACMSLTITSREQSATK